jgi:outer membrane protein assembly factor BamB
LVIHRIVTAWAVVALAVAAAAGAAERPRFTVPYDVLPTAEGDFYISDGESGQVLKYTKLTRRLSVYVTLPARELVGLARLADGTLFVSDLAGGTVWRVNTRRRASRFARVPASTELVLRGQTLYVGSLEDNKVYAIDVRTGKRSEVAAVSGPHGLALGPGPSLWVSSPPGSVKRIDLSTNEVTTVVTGDAYKPLFGRSGTLFAIGGGAGGSTISRVGSDGTSTRIVGTGRIGPDRDGVKATTVGLLITDAAFDPNGTLVVAQAKPRPKIRRVDLKTGRITTIVTGR